MNSNLFSMLMSVRELLAMSVTELLMQNLVTRKSRSVVRVHYTTQKVSKPHISMVLQQILRLSAMNWAFLLISLKAPQLWISPILSTSAGPDLRWGETFSLSNKKQTSLLPFIEEESHRNLAPAEGKALTIKRPPCAALHGSCRNHRAFLVHFRRLITCMRVWS